MGKISNGTFKNDEDFDDSEEASDDETDGEDPVVVDYMDRLDDEVANSVQGWKLKNEILILDKIWMYLNHKN